MRISSSDQGLGCQSVYRVIGVLNGDASFYLADQDPMDEEEFHFDSVLTGSGALAVHADRRDSHMRQTPKILTFTPVIK